MALQASLVSYKDPTKILVSGTTVWVLIIVVLVVVVVDYYPHIVSYLGKIQNLHLGEGPEIFDRGGEKLSGAADVTSCRQNFEVPLPSIFLNFKN